MKEQILNSAMFWFLWALAIFSNLAVLNDIFIAHRMGTSEQLFLIFMFTSLPIIWGYYSERQDVCS